MIFQPSTVWQLWQRGPKLPLVRVLVAVEAGVVLDGRELEEGLDTGAGKPCFASSFCAGWQPVHFTFACLPVSG